MIYYLKLVFDYYEEQRLTEEVFYFTNVGTSDASLFRDPLAIICLLSDG
jgi:hypothetical protein